MPNGRCRFHGGLSTGAPKGNKNGAKPGSLYSKFLSDEERAFEGDIEASLGDLRHELIFAKVMVTRFAAKLTQPEEQELESVADTQGDGLRTGSSRTITTRVRNYHAEADRWIGRVASLTKQINDIEMQKREIALAEVEFDMKSAEARDLADHSEASALTVEVVRLTADKETPEDA